MNIIVEGPRDDERSDVDSGRGAGVALRSLRGRQNATVRFSQGAWKGEGSTSEGQIPGGRDVADLGQSASKLGRNVGAAAHRPAAFAGAFPALEAKFTRRLRRAFPQKPTIAQALRTNRAHSSSNWSGLPRACNKARGESCRGRRRHRPHLSPRTLLCQRHALRASGTTKPRVPRSSHGAAELAAGLPRPPRAAQLPSAERSPFLILLTAGKHFCRCCRAGVLAWSPRHALRHLRTKERPC